MFFFMPLCVCVCVCVGGCGGVLGSAQAYGLEITRAHACAWPVVHMRVACEAKYKAMQGRRAACLRIC